jgi:hypothetical protein
MLLTQVSPPASRSCFPFFTGNNEVEYLMSLSRRHDTSSDNKELFVVLFSTVCNKETRYKQKSRKFNGEKFEGECVYMFIAMYMEYLSFVCFLCTLLGVF